LSQPTINDVVHEYYKALKAGVEARAGGRIKLEIYPANQLGQLPAVVEGVALGTIEAGSAANGFWVSLEPRFQVLDAPGLFDDVLPGNKVVNDPATRSRLATFGADKGVEILAPGVYSPMCCSRIKAFAPSPISKDRRCAPRAAPRSRSSRSRGSACCRC